MLRPFEVVIGWIMLTRVRLVNEEEGALIFLDINFGEMLKVYGHVQSPFFKDQIL